MTYYENFSHHFSSIIDRDEDLFLSGRVRIQFSLEGRIRFFNPNHDGGGGVNPNKSWRDGANMTVRLFWCSFFCIDLIKRKSNSMHILWFLQSFNVYFWFYRHFSKTNLIMAGLIIYAPAWGCQLLQISFSMQKYQK